MGKYLSLVDILKRPRRVCVGGMLIVRCGATGVFQGWHRLARAKGNEMGMTPRRDQFLFRTQTTAIDELEEILKITCTQSTLARVRSKKDRAKYLDNRSRI
jgi:hypothetical protein